ncbi:MAG: DUF2835 domain-containing protein [Oceanospirillales bacterium]|uniref:Uncharacterized protein DUF2835 n=1 Tax=Marinobacterium halophilum TaxID=267374 RepID=A0A2P8EUT9_9GAMM|nr:DUF2835 domain-containing protein [Marinobacterium halophilum]MBR9827325.1 DUF2835 domain-containing protein [Oceanospirillales bacterium]PSL13237.1 uncharacterized protein DUF2835 [Marinobacterium halophilum]
MNEIVVDLRISSDECLKLYNGPSRVVSTRARDGRRVQFPAAVLRPWVLHDGVRGCFRIRFTPEGKFSDIKRLS